ncbi:hypothetical protein HYH02_006742 [Chlamydomonas schloesseri]|uniref:Uncharacterized protein n=1 Tax=Chlamydomonas schloesseri TaxID=2026947 RepID=A0A835WIT7_9CHLO|nr:hypothetical protein HYH02_006742 [Chlamydomonas schloesseri]|eukprot:KAG2448157.1 hypothetical protein HYH02_006742 [Chlamydomonas schloesseri]
MPGAPDGLGGLFTLDRRANLQHQPLGFESSGNSLAGALAQQQRSALVALACPDLPPSALSGRLHLQAQQRARSALGRHERACASGYRPHLRAAATARAVLAAGAGLAPADEAAAAREQQALHKFEQEQNAWAALEEAVKKYEQYQMDYKRAASKSVAEKVAARSVQEAAGEVRLAVAAVDVRAVAARLASLRATSAAEAEERQRTPTFGPVRYEPLEGVSVPAWLLEREADCALLPARAALLLHGHTILGDPPVDLADATKQHPELRATQDFEERTRYGHHLAMAAVVAAALQRYWQHVPTLGTAASAPAPPQPLQCCSATELAAVLAALRAVPLWYEQQRSSGALGVLTSLTRPAVLLRVAAVYGDLASRIPPEHVTSALWHFLRHTLQEALRKSMEAAVLKRQAAADKRGGGGGKGAAVARATAAAAGASAVAAAAAVVGSTAAAAAGAGDEAAQGLMEWVRTCFVEFLEKTRKIDDKSCSDSIEKARKLAAEGSSKAESDLRSAQNRAKVAALRAATDSRVISALFDPLPLPAAAAAAMAAPAASEAMPLATDTHTAGWVSGSSRVSWRHEDMSPSGPGAAQQLAAARVRPAPAPPEVVVRMLWQQAGEQWDRLPKGQERSQLEWELDLNQYSSRTAVARAIVGALTTCWEAAATAAAAGGATTQVPPAPTSPPPPSPSPSSLVLQGAPAICYSLARTAAVNYVLDRVARGLAAAAATSSSPTDAVAPGAGSKSLLLPPHQGGSEAAAALVAAAVVADTTPSFQRACGWPLVMTLSSSEELREQKQQQANEALRELLEPLDPKGEELEKLAKVCLSATWWATATQLSASPPCGGSGGTGGSGPCRLLAEAVADRARQCPLVRVHGCSPGAIAQTVCGLERAISGSPRRAALLAPSYAEQTAATAAKLAELSEVSRKKDGASPPRELVVVPVLDPDALERCTQAAQRLRGIVCLVLRELTQPVSVPAAAAGEGTRAEVAEGPAPGFAAPRELRPDWQVRLPLTLDRAVARIASVSFMAVRWQLCDLSRDKPSQMPAAAKHTRAVVESLRDLASRGRLWHGAGTGHGANKSAPAAVPAAENGACVGGGAGAKSAETDAQAQAQAQAAKVEAGLRVLPEALADLVAADDTSITRDGDGGMGSLQAALGPLGHSVLSKGAGLLSPSGKLAELVPGEDGLITSMGGYIGAYILHRHPQQALQLLVAEAAHGRPTELLGLSPGVGGGGGWCLAPGAGSALGVAEEEGEAADGARAEVPMMSVMDELD